MPAAANVAKTMKRGIGKFFGYVGELLKVERFSATVGCPPWQRKKIVIRKHHIKVEDVPRRLNVAKT